MKTEIIDLKNEDSNLWNKLYNYYKEEKIIAIPTETVYGLSADATNYNAVDKIYKAKGRPSDNPLIVHFYSTDQLSEIVDLENKYVKKIIDNFWPGELTLVLKLKNKKIIANNVTAGLDTLAVRMPRNSITRKLLKHTQILLAAPSANISGKPSPTKFEHVYNDLNNKIDAILCGEDSDVGIESTVLDCTKFPFIILRPGSISLEEIASVIGEDNILYNDDFHEEKPSSPGMKYKHYSPEGDFVVLDDSIENIIKFLEDKNEDYGFISYKKYESKLKNLKVNIQYLSTDENNIKDANRNLYNILRQFDLDNVKKIYMLNITETEKNKALLNRINKATTK